MTNGEIKAFFEGIATSNIGGIPLSQGEYNDIANITFSDNYGAIITMANGDEYTIESVNMDENKIMMLRVVKDGVKKKIYCTYDSNNYLQKVGNIDVNDIDELNITEELNLQNKTVIPSTENISVTADTGFDGLGTVTVKGAFLKQELTVSSGKTDITYTPTGSDIGYAKVIVKAIELEEKEVTPTKNGLTVYPDEKLGLSKVVVNPPPLLETTVTPTKNGSEITVPSYSSAVGYSKVTVNGDSNLISGNIKQGVTIFNVTGTYGGGGGGGSADITQIIFDDDYKAVISTSDGAVYNITKTTFDDRNKITSIRMDSTSDQKHRLIECTYDSNDYLINVGDIDVSDIEKLNIENSFYISETIEYIEASEM